MCDLEDHAIEWVYRFTGVNLRPVAQAMAGSAARQDLQPRIDAIAKSTHVSLAAQKAGIKSTVAACDDALRKLDFETAAKIVPDLKAKLDSYDAAVSNIESAKSAYNHRWQRVKPDVDLITKDGKPQDEKVAALLAAIDQSVKAEDYKKATDQVLELEKALAAIRVQMDPDEISGSGKPDEETQKVMQAIANAKTRALTYFNGHELQITQAMMAFDKEALNEIDKEIDPKLAGWVGSLDTLVSVVSTVTTIAYPPAKGYVAGAKLVYELGKSFAGKVKADEAKPAQTQLKAAVDAFMNAANAATHAAFAAEADAFTGRLTNLANQDKKVWDSLAIGGERQLEDAVKALGITDPAQSNPFDAFLKPLMAKFSALLAEVKYELGKTALERMEAESLPSQDSYKELHKKMDDATKAGEAKADEMEHEHRFGR